MADETNLAKWQKYRKLLDNIFFSTNEILKRNSEDYAEFWSFVERYEKAKARAGRVKKQAKDRSNESQVDKTSHLNTRFSVDEFVKRFKEYKKTHHFDEKERKNCLSNSDIKDFGSIILFYLDFQEKQKIKKLEKLKHDQESLPIRQYRDQILYAVKTSQVVLIAGDTGCGKSTQVPQYFLADGYTKIACTQPRRIACISLSKRVSYETQNEYGSEVAYQVRFDGNKTRATRILFLTEGLLLRQFQTDPDLTQYSVVVVDEVHERHLNGDFLLGVLRCLLQQRKDLKLVLMSATININLFTSYFQGAPVIQVPGRLYPISVQYVPHFVEPCDKTGKTERLDPSPYLKIMQLIDKKYPSNERGDLLIFMSGMAEIEVVIEAANEYATKTQKWIILPLHSSLSIEDQDKVFDIAPDGVRKCVVSTNIAETSITIDGIRFIVDSGKVKEMNFDGQLKMQRLQEFWISQASAEQRKGRAGRTGPGVCFRLYSEDDYSVFAQYSTPEIHRVPLDNLVLQMASLGLRDATKFPFIDPPAKSSLESAVAFLKQQNALDETGDLTTTGRMLALLPVDVVVGKMLIMGALFDMTDPVLVIAAALSIQSPFTRRLGGEFQVDVDQRRSELLSEHGDPFTLLNVYDEWIRIKADRHSHSRKWCRRRAIEEERLYEITKLKRQFENLLVNHGLMNSTRRSEDRRKTNSSSVASEKRRKLIGLKREYHQKTRKRKILKMHDYQDATGGSDVDEAEDDGIDIQAVQFQLTHDLDKLHKISANRQFSYREINILKIIICSGLYPQVAVPDESNPWRRDSDRTYHSREKQFLNLHPTSVYSARPELLYKDNDQQDKTTSIVEGRADGAQELLAFVSLLETNKAYIVNSMKIPVLQILLLFSRELDTNSDCTRVICDGWLELSFKDTAKAQNLLSDVIKLRTAWDMLLEIRLSMIEETAQRSRNDSQLSQRAVDLQYDVSYKLASFIDSKIQYKYRRILSPEFTYLYTSSIAKQYQDDAEGGSSPEETLDDKVQKKDSSSPEEALDNKVEKKDGSSPEEASQAEFREQKKTIPFLPDSGGVPHPTKGGLRVSEYLTYGCVRDDLSEAVARGQAEFLREHYHCEACGAHLICNILERLEHDKSCLEHDKEEGQEQRDEKKITEGDGSQKESNDIQANPLCRDYFCSVCKEQFKLTPSEILKHKRTHK
eukprot:gene5629-6325_t